MSEDEALAWAYIARIIDGERPVSALDWEDFDDALETLQEGARKRLKATGWDRQWGFFPFLPRVADRFIDLVRGAA